MWNDLRYETRVTPEFKGAKNTHLDLVYRMVKTKNPTLFSVHGLDGSYNYEIESGSFSKDNRSEMVNGIEVKLTKALKELSENSDLGVEFVDIEETSPTSNKQSFVDGLTLGEELMYSSNQTIDGVVDKIKHGLSMSNKISAKLPSIIATALTTQEEDFLIDGGTSYLSGSVPSVLENDFPLSSKLVSKANSSGIEFELPSDFVYLIGLFESTAKKHGSHLTKWTLDSYAENFIGDTRIDLNSLKLGFVDDYMLLDTPYMIGSDDFWMQLNKPENLKVFREIEIKKKDLYLSTAKTDDEKQSLNLAYQSGRVLRNIMQMFNDYENAMSKKNLIEDAVSSKKFSSGIVEQIADVKRFEYVNKILSRYHQADVGVNNILKSSEDNEVLSSISSQYKEIMGSLVQKMVEDILPEKSDMQKSFELFSLARKDYKNLKANYQVMCSTE